MDKVLRTLYDSFYALPEMAELTEAVEANRTLLRERLANELKNYKENERSTPAGDAGLSARFVSEEGEPI